MNLSEIVNVVISRETANVSKAGFGTLLIVGPNCNVDGRLEYFTDAVSAVAKITGTDTREEALINDAFSQNPAPVRVALGGLSASRTAIFSGTYSAGAVACTVNGEEVTQDFTSTLDDTITALAVKIQALADVVTAVYTANTNTLVITPATGKNVGVSFDLTDITGTMEVVVTSTELAETYSTALSAILTEQPDWYGIAAATQTVAKQELIADWAEANKKFFDCGSADANTVDQTLANDSTSIAAYAKSNTLDRTYVSYLSAAATKGVEAAAFVKTGVLYPGSYTRKFKTLAGITADTLTSTQSTNARAKKANTYETIGGINMQADGTVGSGEYADTIIFIDWLTVEIQTNVFGALARTAKTPYTAAGYAVVEAQIDKALRLGQDRGGISPKAFDADGKQIGGYFITMPALADASVADKASRTLNDVKWTAFLAGAIHSTVINGIVTL